MISRHRSRKEHRTSMHNEHLMTDITDDMHQCFHNLGLEKVDCTPLPPDLKQFYWLILKVKLGLTLPATPLTGSLPASAGPASKYGFDVFTWGTLAAIETNSHKAVPVNILISSTTQVCFPSDPSFAFLPCLDLWEIATAKQTGEAEGCPAARTDASQHHLTSSANSNFPQTPSLRVLTQSFLLSIDLPVAVGYGTGQWCEAGGPLLQEEQQLVLMETMAPVGHREGPGTQSQNLSTTAHFMMQYNSST
ncbi:hypothetical protein Bbelb_183430 [Branchiostoma belcheri]|nr:hypothetical protein Bbelb_183430 [Branchiostoma belcheri]